MTRRPRRLATGLAWIGLLVFGIGGCERSPGPPSAPAAPATAKVEVIAPLRMTIRRVTEQPGQVEASEVTPIHAKVAGYIETLTVDLGDQVRAGQLLARLSVPEIDADVSGKQALIDQANAEQRQSEAEIKVAEAAVLSVRARLVAIQAGVKRARADRARWQAEHRRMEQLHQEKALTGSLLDETKSKLQAAEAAEDEVAAQVKAAEAALRESEARLDKALSDAVVAAAKIPVARFGRDRAQALKSYAAIVAPFDGTIIKRGVDTGHLTQPGAAAEPLFVISRAGAVTVSVAVPELFADAVRPGQRVEVRVQALRDRKFEGTVSRTAFALDPKTRTLTTEIDLPNPERALRPGQFVHASITLEEHPGALTLPVSSLLRDGALTACVRVVAGKAERAAIALGIIDGARVEILSGLGENDRVVQANPASLVNGQPVEPEQAPGKPPPP